VVCVCVELCGETLTLGETHRGEEVAVLGREGEGAWETEIKAGKRQQRPENLRVSIAERSHGVGRGVVSR
jgi:hypothetical protein